MLAAVAPEDLWRAWSIQPLAAASATIALAFFFQGFFRLRRRRLSLAPWSRAALFTTGVAIVLLGICSPLDAVGEQYLQSAHMLQHVLIADLGVALAVLAVRGPLAVFLLPRDLLVPLARSRRLRGALDRLLRPSLTVSLWLGLTIVWHVPSLYERSLTNPVLHQLQHVSFIVVGTLVWVLLIDPTRHGRLSTGERIGVAAVLLFAGQALSYVMVFSYGPFYGTYADQPERLLGLSPLTDQQLAGVVMMVEQTLTLGAAVVALLLAARRERAPALPAATGA